MVIDTHFLLDVPMPMTIDHRWHVHEFFLCHGYVIFIVMVIVIVMAMIISIVIITVMVAFPVGDRSWQALSAPACIPRMTETSKARHIKSSDIGIL